MSIVREDIHAALETSDPRHRFYLVKPTFVAHDWLHHLAGLRLEYFYEPRRAWPLRHACLLAMLPEQSGRCWPDQNEEINA